MGALATYAANGLQNLTLRGETFAAPTDVYLGWFTTPPSADGSAIQVSGGGHAREVITFNAASGGTIEQAAPVTWAPFHAGADQMIVGWGIWDAASGGNLLAYGRTPSKRIAMGAAWSVSGIVVASNDRAMSDYLSNAWLDHLFRNDAYSPPSTVHFGHYLVTPTASTAGTEVSDAGYDRQGAEWDSAVSGAAVLAAPAAWVPLTTDDDQTLAGLALSDANTAGNVLWFHSWPAPIEYTAGDTLELASGSITLRAL
jgi:hypothetical protein